MIPTTPVLSKHGKITEIEKNNRKKNQRKNLILDEYWSNFTNVTYSTVRYLFL